MVTPAQTAAIVTLSLVGAIGQAAVTVRWYEPPAMDDRDPTPLFEAALFFVAFGLLFALVGYSLSYVATLAPPYGRIASLVLVPIGFYGGYASYTDRLGAYGDRATTLMGTVGGFVVGVYPVILLLT